MAKEISGMKVMESYTGVPTLNAAGSLDLYVLETFVRKFYSPSANPLVMAVGGARIEPPVIGQFHIRNYGIPRERLKLIGCSIMSEPPSMKPLYDLYLEGMLGDASFGTTWQHAMQSFGRSDYDFTYIRSPDFVDIDSWFKVFVQAYAFLRREGVTAAIINREDMHRWKIVQTMLESELQLKPVLSQHTGISAGDSNEFNSHHWISVFKKS